MRDRAKWFGFLMLLMLAACGQTATPKSQQAALLPSVTPNRATDAPTTQPIATVFSTPLRPLPTATSQPTAIQTAEVAAGALPLLVMSDAVW